MNIEEFEDASSIAFDECYGSYRENRPKTPYTKMAYQLRRIVNRFEDELDENKVVVLDDLIRFAEHLKEKITGCNDER